MNKVLRIRLDLLAANADKAIKGFPGEKSLSREVSALLCTLSNKPMDCKSIKSCKRILKKHAPLFSYFTSSLFLNFATMLSLCEEPKLVAARAAKAYKYMKRFGMSANNELAIAAMELAIHKPEDSAVVISRMQDFYTFNLRLGRVCKSGNYGYSALLALTDLELGDGIKLIDELYDKLGPNFSSACNAQALSQALTLTGGGPASAGRALILGNALASKGIAVNTNKHFMLLVMLSLIPGEPNAIFRGIEESKEYLLSQKNSSISKANEITLLLLASAVLAYYYNEIDNEEIDHLFSSVATIAALMMIIQKK